MVRQLLAAFQGYGAECTETSTRRGLCFAPGRDVKKMTVKDTRHSAMASTKATSHLM